MCVQLPGCVSSWIWCWREGLGLDWEHPDVDGTGEAAASLSPALDVEGFRASSPTRPKPAAARAQVVLAKPRSRSCLLSSSLLWQVEESDRLLRR